MLLATCQHHSLCPAAASRCNEFCSSGALTFKYRLRKFKVKVTTSISYFYLFIYLLTFGIGVFLVWCQVLVMYWVERSRTKGGTQETACCDLTLANVAACISCCTYLQHEKLYIRVDQT